jgi:methionine-rich copper-binding protein CopC
MKTKNVVVALLLVAMMVCAAMPIAMPSEDAGSSVTVVSLTPVVKSVLIEPAVVTITPGVFTSITVTVEVFAPNGIDWIKHVELTKVEPHYLQGTTLPIALKPTEIEGGIRAKYPLTLDIPCSQPAGDYTLTVTVIDRDGNTATGTATFAVEETLAIAVTDVKFGSVAPGKSSEASSTVTNLGNVRVEFKKKDGIVPSDMHSGGSGIIKAENIAVDWDWKTVLKRGYFSPGESTKEVPFTLSVPYGTPPGTYTGRIVFTPTPAK